MTKKKLETIIEEDSLIVSDGDMTIVKIDKIKKSKKKSNFSKIVHVERENSTEIIGGNDQILCK